MRTGHLWLISTLLPFMVLTGCGQHCCMTGDCHLPPETCLDNSYHDTAPTEAAAIAAQTVSTSLNPEGTKRYISLQECIARALECGRVGGTSIRVLAYDPAITYTAIEEGLSKFDARWFTSMTWSAVDEPIGNTLVAIPQGIGGTNGNGTPQPNPPTSIGNQILAINGVLPSVVSSDAATLESRIEKLLPSGGLAGITFRTDYTLVNEPPPLGVPNPTYTPRLTFSIDQPLLKGFGTTINNNPILVTRLTFDQEREKFSGNVDQLLFSVEQAYWNLYFAYWNLHAQDVGLRQAHDAWQVAKQLSEKKLVTIQDLSALELQYQTFRLARLDAVGGAGRSVLAAERQLRFVVGLPSEDGCRLIPTDTPTTAPYVPDWHASVAAAMDNRPDLAQVRHEIKKVQLDLKRAKDQALPDLRAIASYDVNGLGTRLDGAYAGDPFFGFNGANALRSLASDHFNDWTIGLTLDVPIGFRAAHAQIRRAQLQLEQRMAQLRDLEKQVGFALQDSFRELTQAGEVVRIQANIRKAATDRYQALYEQFRAGLEGPNFLVIAQQQWTTALAAERASVFAYNIALAKFELDKGTIQGYDNVSISDGPLPAGVQERASAHISERQHAHILRERPGDVHLGAPCTGNDGHTEVAPAMPAVAANGPPSIPSLQLDQALSAGSLERVATDTPARAALPQVSKP